MRAAGNVSLLSEEGMPAYGLVLSAAYCAEHECGIDGINRILGIAPDSRPSGMPSRTSTQGPGAHARIQDVQVNLDKVRKLKGPRNAPKAKGVRKPKQPEWGTCTVLLLERYRDMTDERIIENAFRLAPVEGDPQVRGEWGADGFAVYAYDDDSRAVLARLGEALTDADVAVWTGGSGGNPFARPGLVVVVASAVPAEMVEVMAKADRDANALKDAAAATGIADRIEEAKRRENPGERGWYLSRLGYYALAPRYRGEGDPESAYPVMFFLNPQDQRNVNFGWYTVEDLDAWIAGNGPMLKNRPQPDPDPTPAAVAGEPVDDRQATLGF